MSDLSSYNFPNWIWWNTFGLGLLPPWLTLCFLQQIKLCTIFHIWGSIDRQKDQTGGRAQTFSIYMHYAASVVLTVQIFIWIMLNLSQKHVEILRLLICPMSSVDQSLHSQKCHNQEIWNWKLANPKTFMMIHIRIKYSVNLYWNSQDSDFLPFYW